MYMKKKFLLLLIGIVFITACGVKKDDNTGVNKPEVIEQIEDYYGDMLQGKSSDDLKELLKEYNNDLSSYLKKDEFYNDMKKMLEEYLDSSDNVYTSVSRVRDVLLSLEENKYTNKQLDEDITAAILKKTDDFSEKMTIKSNFQLLNFYGKEILSSDEINDYMKNNEIPIIQENGKGGYYDSSEHRIARQYRDIQANGNIITTSITYYGDFAFVSKDTEYVDSMYSIQHNYTNTQYFRGLEIYGKIDEESTFKYTGQYLFAFEKDKTTVFLVKDNFIMNMFSY